MIGIERPLIWGNIVKNLHRLSEPQNHRCCYCGNDMIRHTEKTGSIPRNAITRDHVEPQGYGGKNKDNIVAACSLCNGLRGNMDALAFFNLMQKWFRKDFTLQARWHDICDEEYRVFQSQCLNTHDRFLRGIAIKSVEHGFRHHALLLEHGHRLRA